VEDVKAGRRYASAVFRLGLEENRLEEVFRDLTVLVELFEVSPMFERYLKSPIIGEERKKEALTDRLGGHISQRTLAFLKFLVKKKRIRALRAILERFRELWNEERRLVEVRVTTALRLEVDQRETLSEKIEKLTGRKVELAEEIDPWILGGAVVSYGDRVIDGSIRTQLGLMRKRMREVKIA